MNEKKNSEMTLEMKFRVLYSYALICIIHREKLIEGDQTNNLHIFLWRLKC